MRIKNDIFQIEEKNNIHQTTKCNKMTVAQRLYFQNLTDNDIKTKFVDIKTNAFNLFFK